MKKSVLLLLTMGAALLFWLTIKPIFSQAFSLDRLQNLSQWFFPLFTLTVLVALTALTFLFLEKKIVWLAIVFNGLSFGLIFNPREILTWAGVLWALLLQFSAWQMIRQESRNRLKLNLHSTLHAGAGRLVTAILILLSFAYFLNSGIREAAVRHELPGVVNQTVQVLVGNYIGDNLEHQNPNLRAQATKKILDQIVNALKPYFVFIPPVMAFGLFLVLEGLSPIFIWPGILLAMLMFWILKILKLVKIEVGTREAEIVKF